MELSILHVFVEYTTSKGIIKFTVTKDFHNLCVETSIYNINSSSQDAVNIFKENLENDPHNNNIINIIPTKLLINEKYYLKDCERIVETIKNIKTTSEFSNLKLSNNVIFTVDIPQLKRIYNFFNSFVSNFCLLDSVFKLYLNMLDISNNNEIKKPVIENKNIIKEVIQQPLVIEKPSNDIIKDKEVEQKQQQETLIETILNNYTVNNILKSFIIHNIFKYFRFINDKVVFDKDNNKIIIPNLYDDSWFINIDYIISIYNTILSKELDNIISFNQKKIIETIYNIFESERQDLAANLNVIVLFYLFYLYQYKYIVMKYPDFDMINYFKKEVQQSGINYFIKQLLPSKQFEVEIIDVDFNENDNETAINEISDKYKHLIPISQKDFLNIVLKECDKNKKENLSVIQDFKLSNKNMINVSNMMKNEVIMTKVRKSSFSYVDTENHDDSIDNLLNFEPHIITKAYDYFKKYLTDKHSISLIKDQIPTNIVKLFDYLSKNIQQLFNNKDDISTFNYYKILFENLPASRSYDHYTYLYIIYNIIIPYYFENFKVNEFEDLFLLI